MKVIKIDKYNQTVEIEKYQNKINSLYYSYKCKTCQRIITPIDEIAKGINAIGEEVVIGRCGRMGGFNCYNCLWGSIPYKNFEGDASNG